MELPRPGDQHRLLHRFSGTWEGSEETFGAPGAPPAVSTGRTAFRVGMDGLNVIGDYEQIREGRVSYRGLSVFGVDGGTGEAVWFWFDSMGFVPQPSRGRWSGDRLVLQATYPQGVGRYTYELTSPDRYRFVLETSRDGGEFRTQMRGEYRKVG
jgi:hypothetical protein